MRRQIASMDLSAAFRSMRLRVWRRPVRSGSGPPNRRREQWRDRIFMFLPRNASDPTDFLRISPGKVLEPGNR